MEDLAEMSDQILVWHIPGDMGFEVASRWRAKNEEIDRLKAENERLLAALREMVRVERLGPGMIEVVYGNKARDYALEILGRTKG